MPNNALFYKSQTLFLLFEAWDQMEYTNKNDDEGKRCREMNEYYSEPEWKDAIDRSNLYLMKSMSGYFGYSNHQIKQFVGDAVLKLLDGKREWNPSKYSLFRHITYVVRSDFSHFIPHDQNMTSIDHDSSNRHIQSTDMGPDELYEQIQHRNMLEKHVNATEDRMAINIVESSIEHGIEPHDNAAIAEQYDVGVPDVVNGKKRLKRILKSF